LPALRDSSSAISSAWSSIASAILSSASERSPGVSCPSVSNAVARGLHRAVDVLGVESGACAISSPVAG
jgi:hypothetical protein